MITVQKSGGACGNVACLFSSYALYGVFWTELKLLSFENAQIVNKQKILRDDSNLEYVCTLFLTSTGL